MIAVLVRTRRDELASPDNLFERGRAFQDQHAVPEGLIG
jgi:hypothetical protein